MLLVVLCLVATFEFSVVTSADCTEETACECSKTLALHRSLDVSGIPEFLGNELKVCVYDKEFSKYCKPGESSWEDWASLVLDHSLNARWAKLLTSTMHGAEHADVVPKFVVIDEWLRQPDWPPVIRSEDEDEKENACLSSLLRGDCDLAICDIPLESQWSWSRVSPLSVDTIDYSEEYLKSIVVYPKTSACTTDATSDLCGKCVHVLKNSTEHALLLGLNDVGGVCHEDPINIEAWCEKVHERFMERCAHSESPCFLAWEADDYWEEVCMREPGSTWFNENADLDGPSSSIVREYRCDKTRLTMPAQGLTWAIRKTIKGRPEKFKRAIVEAREAVYRSRWLSKSIKNYEDACEVNRMRFDSGLCCPSEELQIQECALKSQSCAIPSTQSRCIWG
jgi:hypothetical protein